MTQLGLRNLFLHSPQERQDVLNMCNAGSSGVTLPRTHCPSVLSRPGSVQLLKIFCCRYLTPKFINNRWTENPGKTSCSEVNVLVTLALFRTDASQATHRFSFTPEQVMFLWGYGGISLSWGAFQSSSSLPLQKSPWHAQWVRALKNI